MNPMWLLIVILGGSGSTAGVIPDTKFEVVEFASEQMCESALKQVLPMRSAFRFWAVCAQSK